MNLKLENSIETHYFWNGLMIYSMDLIPFVFLF
jgi:hypothetical protein